MNLPENYSSLALLVNDRRHYDNAARSANDHSRYQINRPDYNQVLIHDVPFIFTCNEEDKMTFYRHHSIVIEDGIIKDILPAEKIKTRDFHLVYDAGKRGGTVITPGLVNAHSHPPMYLLRSAMDLDEGEDINETLALLPSWEEKMTQEDFALSIIGDLTEQQKFGITSTLSHYNYFYPAEYAARMTGQNLVNGISVASHCATDNSPALIEKLAEETKGSASRLAMTVHYLPRASAEVLTQVSKLMQKYGLLFTCHMAESPLVAEKSLKVHGARETDVLERHNLLNSKTLLSHCIYLQDKEIERLVENKVGIVHLPTSNTIHKSGTFPFWKFFDLEGLPHIALGTDSVVSKSRLDLLSEAYQTRLTHLYSRTVKFSLLFKMMTVNGARVLHYPDRGKLVVGHKADLAFWKLRDRAFMPYNEEKPISLLGNLITHSGGTVRDLMINGKFVIKDRKHLLVNESRLMSALQEKHMEMRARRNS